jgi:acetyl esterase/lipase
MTNMPESLDVVLKADGRGRVRTPADRREELLDEYEKSGLSGTKFAALVGIKYPTFAAWRLRRQQKRQAGAAQNSGTSAGQVRWLEAVVSQAQPSTGGLKVHLPGGAWVELTQAPQAPLVAALVQALEKPLIAC